MVIHTSLNFNDSYVSIDVMYMDAIMQDVWSLRTTQVCWMVIMYRMQVDWNKILNYKVGRELSTK